MQKKNVVGPEFDEVEDTISCVEAATALQVEKIPIHPMPQPIKNCATLLTEGHVIPVVQKVHISSVYAVTRLDEGEKQEYVEALVPLLRAGGCQPVWRPEEALFAACGALLCPEESLEYQSM